MRYGPTGWRALVSEVTPFVSFFLSGSIYSPHGSKCLLHTRAHPQHTPARLVYRGTSLIRNHTPVRPYRRHTRQKSDLVGAEVDVLVQLVWSFFGVVQHKSVNVFYKQSTPVAASWARYLCRSQIYKQGTPAEALCVRHPCGSQTYGRGTPIEGKGETWWARMMLTCLCSSTAFVSSFFTAYSLGVGFEGWGLGFKVSGLGFRVKEKVGRVSLRLDLFHRPHVGGWGGGTVEQTPMA